MLHVSMAHFVLSRRAMTLRKPFLGLLALAVLAPGVSRAESSLPDPRRPGLSSPERLRALIDRIKLEQSKVTSLEARFVQHQESEFLLQPEESRGAFSYAAPDRIRWEYDTPKPITMVIDGKTMTTWYRDLNRVEEMKIGRYSERIVRYLGAGGSLESLLQYFDVKIAFPNDPNVPYRLDMTPRFSRVAKRLQELTLWVDPRLFVPTRVRYVTPAGATTEYTFSDLRLNGSLPEDRFVLHLPAGIERRVVDLDRAQ